MIVATPGKSQAHPLARQPLRAIVIRDRVTRRFHQGTLGELFPSFRSDSRAFYPFFPFGRGQEVYQRLESRRRIARSSVRCMHRRAVDDEPALDFTFFELRSRSRSDDLAAAARRTHQGEAK